MNLYLVYTSASNEEDINYKIYLSVSFIDSGIFPDDISATETYNSKIDGLIGNTILNFPPLSYLSALF